MTTCRRTRKRFGTERGSAVVEVVLITPIVALLLMFIVFVGRVTSAQGDVTSAAQDAARAASTQRDPTSARRAATDTASSSLSGAGLDCTNVQVPVDVGDFHPGGTVSVQVRCTASLSGLGLLGIGGSKTVTAKAQDEIVDSYRAVTP